MDRGTNLGCGDFHADCTRCSIVFFGGVYYSGALSMRYEDMLHNYMPSTGRVCG
jgi:hypothetical protein